MKRIDRIRKHLPNALTVFRMLCAFALLLFRPLSLWFLLIYAIAGLTDLLDGFFARRFHVENSVGARLYSAADFLLCAVLSVAFLPYYHWPLWIILWIAGIGSIRILAWLVCLFRFRTIAFLHTYSNKATGMLLYLFPFLLWLFNLNIASILLCSVASLSALEELLIQLSSPTINLNRVSLFSR